MVSAMRLFLYGLGFRYRHKFGARSPFSLAGFSALDDSSLFTQRHGFPVPLGRPHASQTDLFLQDQPTLDDEDLLDHGDDRGVAVFSNGWNSLNWPADRDTLDFDALAGKRLINQVVMTIRMDMHPNPALNLSALNRDVLDKQRDNNLRRI
jgi:hypothetical protein